MIIYNFLPQLHRFLEDNVLLPSKESFNSDYLIQIEEYLRPMLEDFAGFRQIDFYDFIKSIDWGHYRSEAISINPIQEQKRVEKNIFLVESLLQKPLKGELVLFGAFTMMDGYARFNEGTHRVYIGADESHGRGAYLDILIAHELTHVARESSPTVWTGYGLNPKMNHDEFVENQPLLEHLFSEGFSCFVSQLAHPGHYWGHYVYQEPNTGEQIIAHAKKIDEHIKSQIRNTEAHYHDLYDITAYGIADCPRYVHYAWAMEWVRSVALDLGFQAKGPAALTALCSKDLKQHALDFDFAKSMTKSA